ncbi:MAG: sigma-70 family RNA polymerase sigma factor [Clostridiales bacterium]|nr:sigma-70 family RNA polymerase sigma factor [Clostridiales bacterium]
MAMTEQQVQLVIAAQNGDMKSFEALFAIYYDKVYALARMIIRNGSDAEDILQETFVSAWRKLHTLQTPQTFSVWVQVIARNLCHMQLRKKNLAILLDAEQDMENFGAEESEEMLPAVYAERADLRERLGRIIDGLSEVQRQAIVLYYFNGLSVEEIADVMECSANTVKTRLYLARKAIRSEVEEEERKSGEKFYGLIGIPLLPLGKLIQTHMESLTGRQVAYNASWHAISDAIASSHGAGAAAVAAETQTKKMKGVETVKNMSLKAKIMMGISIAAALGAVAVLVILLVTGGTGNNPQIEADPSPDPSFDVVVTATEEPNPTPEPTQALDTAAPTEEVSATDTPAPAPTNTPSPTQSTTWSYAYIVNWSERMDEYQNYAFDYVDWLTGEEAITKYMQDYGCSREDAKNDTEEYGYIRNVNPQIRWFYPTVGTTYYMPDAIMSVKPIKVNYATFRDTMIPAIESNDMTLTFVKVTVSGETIVKVEWVYHP